MRSSILLCVLVVALALTSVSARMHHRVATPKKVQEVDLPVACLAECAAKAVVCVGECIFTDSIGGLSCKEKCGIAATECSSECALADSNPKVIDSSNIEATFAKMQSKVGTTVHDDFQSFKTKYNKKYASKELEAHRFAIFTQNMLKAAELHKKNPEAEFGVNQYADLHDLEFRRQYLNFLPAVGDAALRRMNVPLTSTPKHTPAIMPTNFDWRTPDQNRPVGVTAVKDQGQCGSCWAFSATEEVESAWILAGHPAVDLAPEQTVDCDTVDQGCNGGDTVTAYAYMEKNGLETESAYPYWAGLTGSAGKCVYNSSEVVAKMSGFTYATPGCTDSCTKQNEALLKTNLYNVAPVSICVDASTWQLYSSGILTGASGCQSAYTALDHCVQLTGFGVDPSGTAFWSVRNSWNTYWGEAGYIRLSYGANTCGVADEATQVQI